MSDIEHSCAFDPIGYLNQVYSVDADGEPKDEVVKFMIDTLPIIVSSHCKNGGTLIDIGSGPVLSQMAILSKCYKQIYMAEYEEEGRNFLKKWLKNESIGFDWKPYFERIAKNEGSGDHSTLEERLRSAIQEVIACDIFQANCGLLDALKDKQFDAVSCFGVLGVNCKTLDEYRRTLRNTISLIKPGQFFIYSDLIQFHPRSDESSQNDNDAGHYGLQLTADTFKKELFDAGLSLIEWKQAKGENGYTEFITICQK